MTPALCPLLLLHHPFPALPHLPHAKSKAKGLLPEEAPFFAELLETFIPLLKTLFNLDKSGLPWSMGLAVSPLLASLLSDGARLERFALYLERKIEFGIKETERLSGQARALAIAYCEADTEKRRFFFDECGGNYCAALAEFQKRGRVELFTTAATYAFLPFFAGKPLQVQIEAAVAAHREAFEVTPRSFWLPELGWSEKLDAPLKAAGFDAVVLSARALVLGSPSAEKGSFYPAKTPAGLTAFAADRRAASDLAAFAESDQARARYRMNFADAAFELPAKEIRPFVGTGGARLPSGYRYYRAGRENADGLYSPHEALALAREDGGRYFRQRSDALAEAGRLMQERPLSLCAASASFFGARWNEGFAFFESFVREAAASGKVSVESPGAYAKTIPPQSVQALAPAFSSGPGYAQLLLDSSNDWLYRHLFRALERMTELADRFPGDSGLKERTLNQAAREALIAMGLDWPAMLSRGQNADYAAAQMEESLRNFTTIYESLGGNYLSAEWLTSLERRHAVFPFLNYRMFATVH